MKELPELMFSISAATQDYYSLLASFDRRQDTMSEQNTGGKSPARTSDDSESPAEISDSADSFFSLAEISAFDPYYYFVPFRPPWEENHNNNGGSYDGMLDLSLGSLSSSHRNLNLNIGSPPNNNTITPSLSSDLSDLSFRPRSHPRVGIRCTAKKKQSATTTTFPPLRVGKSETITPPYEWATNRRARVHTLDYLESKQINKITGDVQCRRCEARYKMEFDLRTKFGEVETFIWENRGEMAERAPDVWKNPILPTCSYCGQENSVKPVIGSSKKAINWLFLLLGQLLGCCTLDQLRYFCKHTRNHRTGAKDRVLYLAYLNLCKQLDPTGPFDRN